MPPNSTPRILVHATQTTDSGDSDAHLYSTAHERTPHSSQSITAAPVRTIFDTQNSFLSSQPNSSNSSNQRSAYGGRILPPTNLEPHGDPYASASPMSPPRQQLSAHSSFSSYRDDFSRDASILSGNSDAGLRVSEPLSRADSEERHDLPRGSVATYPPDYLRGDARPQEDEPAFATPGSPLQEDQLAPIIPILNLGVERHDGDDILSPPPPPPNQIRRSASVNSSQYTQDSLPFSQRPENQRQPDTPFDDSQFVPTQIVATQDYSVVPTQLNSPTDADVQGVAIEEPKTLTQFLRQPPADADEPQHDRVASSTAGDPADRMVLDDPSAAESSSAAPHYANAFVTSPRKPLPTDWRALPALASDPPIPGLDEESTAGEEDETTAPSPQASRTGRGKGKGKGKSKAKATVNKRKAQNEKEKPTSSKRIRLQSEDSPGSGGSTASVYVFAPHEDHFYYRATVTMAEKSVHVVRFDDGMNASVSSDSVYQYLLAPGDKVSTYGSSGRLFGQIADVEDWERTQLATLTVTDEASGESVEYDIKGEDVRVHSDWVAEHWQGRRCQTVQAVKPKSRSARSKPISSKPISAKPTSSKPTSSARGDGNLHDVGIVISLSEVESDATGRKARYTEELRRRGAAVYSDWWDLYRVDDSPEARPQDRFVYAGKASRLFLLADKEATTVKYLFALACGIPCLNVSILDDPQGFDNWQAHLLPAGMSRRLNSFISQRLAYTWTQERLNSPNDSLLAPKAFRDKSVLFVGEFFTDKSKGAASSLPKILWALGASRVDVVSEVGKRVNLAVYDVAITHPEGKRIILTNINEMTTQDLKEIIITGLNM